MAAAREGDSWVRKAWTGGERPRDYLRLPPITSDDIKRNFQGQVALAIAATGERSRSGMAEKLYHFFAFSSPDFGLLSANPLAHSPTECRHQEARSLAKRRIVFRQTFVPFSRTQPALGPHLLSADEWLQVLFNRAQGRHAD